MRINWKVERKSNEVPYLSWNSEGKRPLVATVATGRTAYSLFSWEVEWEYENEASLDLWIRGRCLSLEEAVERAETMIHCIMATGLKPEDINPIAKEEDVKMFDDFLKGRAES